MPDPYNNNGSTYINPNVCKSFSVVISAVMTPLSEQTCSEAYFYNHGVNSNDHIAIYDSPTSYYTLDGKTGVNIMGLTNMNLVSAIVTKGNPVLLTYRTAYFSCLPQR